MNFWKKFKKGLFTKSQFLVGVTLTMLTTSALVYGYQLLSLNVFSSGDTISSSEVNDNFSQINDALSRSNNAFEVALGAGQVLPTPTGNNYTWTNYTGINVDSIIFDDSEFGYAAEFQANGAFTIQEAGFYQYLMKGKVNQGGGTTPGAYGEIRVGFENASGNTQIMQIGLSSNDPGFRSGSNTKFLDVGDVVKVKGNADCCGAAFIEVLGGSLTLKIKKL